MRILHMHLDTFIDFHFKTKERFGEAFCNIKEHPVTIIPKVTCGKLPYAWIKSMYSGIKNI